MNYFSVSHAVAVRSGVIAQRYRTADDRFILNEDDMRHIRMLPEEYITGLDAIVLTEMEAMELIAQGGHQMGERIGSADSSAEQVESEESDDSGEAADGESSQDEETSSDDDESPEECDEDSPSSESSQETNDEP